MRNRIIESSPVQNDEEQGTAALTSKHRMHRKLSASTRRTFLRKANICMLMAIIMFGIIWCIVGRLRIHQQKVAAAPILPLPLKLLSTPLTATASTSVRGNLGPPSVVLSNSTADWLKDRWQAASDMHGKAIYGAHWVQLDFARRVSVQVIVLDWEAAYSDDYSILGTLRMRNGQNVTTTLFDTAAALSANVSTRQWGQSPGVAFTCPMHVEHSISLFQASPVDSLRLVIRKPAKYGWGVSLWRFQVFGYDVLE
ncbi:hypothetical protein MPSEU_001075900 [Mayamaea pseudoterrestris]|nr:hypothetical protein MPSEU_001075900 [Mayamaea pseudoterrestris]